MFINYGKQLILLFEELLNLISQLNLHIQTDLKELPLWVDNGADGFVSNRSKVMLALGNFSPTPGLSPQETFKCPGAVASTLTTLDLIAEVNAAKNIFKALVRLCHQEMKQDVSKFVRDTLAHAGYPSIKLKQVFRHIAFITYHPRRISWTKGKHTTSKLLSKKASEEMLIKAGKGEHIEIQRVKLNNLDHKAKLVQYRCIKPIWVVNIASFKENKRSKYEDIRTALPLFYLHDQQLTGPMVGFGKLRVQNRKTRSDKKIESVPFLPSISVYQYKNNITKRINGFYESY